MDFVDPILFVAEKFYKLVGEVKTNKKRSARLAHRVETLMEVVRALKVKGLNDNPRVLRRALKELKITLDLAQDLVTKYGSTGFFSRIGKAYDLKEDFEMLNERLNDAFQVLSLGLHIDHKNRLASVFAVDTRRAEDREDWESDRIDLQTILQSQIALQDVADSTNKEVLEISKMLQTPAEKGNLMTPTPKASLQGIQEIPSEELEFDVPKKPFMETPTHKLYKGQYQKFPVAIKQYTNTTNTSPSTVRSTFHREVVTMKHFESPNILRLYGICIQTESGRYPNYLVVMELCEKGSLREVLSGNSTLSWGRRARMSLDAAQALYRLHQTKKKFKVHGCINSFKFLVDSGYRVKLGCLELAQTETSMGRNEYSSNNSLVYCSPQQLDSLNIPYDKQCEMYSFGIVLWEIATRQIPFDGLSEDEMHKKVSKDKFIEPLPGDCPPDLAALIDACRSYEPFDRPTAGELVDKLRKLVLELGED